MITINSVPKTILLLLVVLLLVSYKNEPDPLHKRVFNISLSETRNGVVAKKVIMDKLYFKNGKLFSDFIYTKYGYKWIRYRINRDSVFNDSTQTKVRLLEVEASATNEVNQTINLTFVTCEWDIDGVLKITKNDRLKRYYDMWGREKGGKPKKEKKKKEKKIQIIRDPF